ncbi:MAG: hypothetical protein RLZZ577_1570 [Bacteroidota bacterium]
MKILKFGGKSLSNGDGLDKVVAIILDKVNQGEKIAVVVSARGNATDELEEMLSIAAKNESYKPQLEQFKLEQQNGFDAVDFTEEFTVLEKLFEGVSLIDWRSAFCQITDCDFA